MISVGWITRCNHDGTQFKRDNLPWGRGVKAQYRDIEEEKMVGRGGSRQPFYKAGAVSYLHGQRLSREPALPSGAVMMSPALHQTRTRQCSTVLNKSLSSPQSFEELTNKRSQIKILWMEMQGNRKEGGVRLSMVLKACLNRKRSCCTRLA